MYYTEYSRFRHMLEFYTLPNLCTDLPSKNSTYRLLTYHYLRAYNMPIATIHKDHKDRRL
jgi:hypothetical protein